HSHGRRRGVDAALGLGLGDALDAMAAALITKTLIHLISTDAEGDFLVSALLAGAERNLLNLPTPVARVMRVHVVEVAGEQRRLVAPRAGADLHDIAAETPPRP